MQKNVQIFLWGLLIIGALLGTFIAPAIHIDARLGTVIGGLAGAGISFWLFPELRKVFTEGWNTKQSKQRRERVAKQLQLGWRRSLTHPTNLPMTLGLLWFGGCTALIMLFPNMLDHYIENISVRRLLFFLPFLFLFGLSAFLMILRRQGIDQFGHRYHGFGVYFNGILRLIFGWGGCILLIFFTIFD